MSFDAIRWALAQDLPCTEKMVLVVLADFHNKDSGRCNPEKATIAQIAGIGDRTADRVLIRLRDRGLVNYEPTSGRSSNRYTLSLWQGSTPSERRGTNDANPVTESTNPVTESTNPVTVTPEPIRTSYNQNISANSRTRCDKSQRCPHQEIVKTYHRTLPMLPTVRVMTKNRMRLLKSRWTEDPERQSLDWWREFFKYIADSDFLTGKTNGTGDRPPFCADFEWLIRPSNFVKVIEGKYHRGAS